MAFVLFVAILFTGLFINYSFTDYLNAKVNVYSTEKIDEQSKMTAKIRLVSVFLASVFWAIYITFK